MNSTEEKWGQWLPPSPHREAIFDWVEHGAANIVQWTPGESPVLFFEDGGSIELSKARFTRTPRECFYHADRPEDRMRAEYRATQYSEVCTTLDELKLIIAEGPEAVSEQREYVQSLLDDARYMIDRMWGREEEYKDFAERLGELHARMAEAPIQPRTFADKGLDEIEHILNDDVAFTTTDRQLLDELAEHVRLVCQGQERCLRERRRIPLAAWRAYVKVKGARDWSDGESDDPTPPYAANEG